MAKTVAQSDYTNTLVQLRDDLADNLTTKGVPAQRTEKFNTLVPKVLEIETGGRGGTPLITEPKFVAPLADIQKVQKKLFPRLVNFSASDCVDFINVDNVQGTRVKCLVTTGQQYIDTGVIPNPYYTVEVKFTISRATPSWDTIFGTRNGGYGRFTARFSNSVSGLLGVQYSTSYSSSAEFFDDEDFDKSDAALAWHTVKLAKNEYYLDETLKKYFSSPTGSTLFPYSLFLCALNDAGTANDFGYFKIEYCKIWDDNDVLIRNFEPYKYAGIGYFHDSVNNKNYFSKSANFDFEEETA